MQRKGYLGGLALVVALGGLATASLADNPANWSFVLQTSGADVFWTSSTTVDTGGDEYTVSFAIDKLEVRVVEFPLLGWIDVTSNLDPNVTSGSETYPGPLPIIFADQNFLYPDPPAPIGFAGDVLMYIDGSGFGQGALTNIVFGQITVEVFGQPVTVTLSDMRLSGSATAEAVFLPDLGACCDFSTYVCSLTDETTCTTLGGAWQGVGTTCGPAPCLCFGDTDCDGDVDFDDITLFVASIGDDGTAWSAAYVTKFGSLPPCDFLNGDSDADGDVDFDDISPFVNAIGSTCQ
jgi:hypothetical protein